MDAIGEITFESQVLSPIITNIIKSPESVAFVIGGHSYTYHDYGKAVSSVRNLIRKKGDCCCIYALVLHDDLLTYASVLALWQEGLSYVPINPAQPVSRNEAIIRQVGIDILLDSEGTYTCHDAETLDTGCDSECAFDLGDMTFKQAPESSLAYILFTSGSTGVPKGVQITRGNLAAFIDSFWKTGISITSSDRCAQLFDLTFDVSVQSFVAPLIAGASVYTVPYGTVKYISAASLISEAHVTFAAMAPSMLTYLKPYFSQLDASSLHACILTAEACTADLIREWGKCASNAVIYDFYGPTEATVYCTSYRWQRDFAPLSHNGIVSIGRPLANVTAVILGEDGKCVTGVEKGELCVSGPQVSSGYWRNEEKNASSFFMMTWLGEPKRFYHTGDLCYLDESGDIMYCGRIDQQAKIQGYRVELGEIEHYARMYFNEGRSVVAIAFQNSSGLTEIALFVEGDGIDEKGLKAYLLSKLPQYMIPSIVVVEKRFPLNKNEKIDRVLLKSKLEKR